MTSTADRRRPLARRAARLVVRRVAPVLVAALAGYAGAHAEELAAAAAAALRPPPAPPSLFLPMASPSDFLFVDMKDDSVPTVTVRGPMVLEPLEDAGAPACDASLVGMMTMEAGELVVCTARGSQRVTGPERERPAAVGRGGSFGGPVGSSRR